MSPKPEDTREIVPGRKSLLVKNAKGKTGKTRKTVSIDAAEEDSSDSIASSDVSSGSKPRMWDSPIQSPPGTPLTKRPSKRLGHKPKEKAKSAMPANSAWRQQRLPSLMHIPTPKTFIPVVGIIAILLLIVGGAVLHAGKDHQAYMMDYTECVSVNDLTYENGEAAQCKDYTDKPNVPCICQVVINTESDMKFPVNLYYGLHNFYQNHRRYVRNRADLSYQKAEFLDYPLENHKKCSPPYQRDGKVIAPCGSIARTLFNDTMTLWKDDAMLPITGSGIAVDGDALAKYRNPIPKGGPVDLKAAFENTIRPINWHFMGDESATIASFGDAEVGYGFENQDFMVWMRTAAFPNFKKLYRKVLPLPGGTLPKGDYVVRIVYNYPAIAMGATKQVHLEEATPLGGRSINIACIYIVTGGVLVAVTVGLILLECISPRKMGDETYITM